MELDGRARRGRAGDGPLEGAGRNRELPALVRCAKHRRRNHDRPVGDVELRGGEAVEERVIFRAALVVEAAVVELDKGVLRGDRDRILEDDRRCVREEVPIECAAVEWCTVASTTSAVRKMTRSSTAS